MFYLCLLVLIITLISKTNDIIKAQEFTLKQLWCLQVLLLALQFFKVDGHSHKVLSKYSWLTKILMFNESETGNRMKQKEGKQ